MTAKDKDHDSVVNALIKSGWTVISEQVRLVVKNRYVYLDIQARNQNNNDVILIEVKGFNTVAPVIICTV